MEKLYRLLNNTHKSPKNNNGSLFLGYDNLLHYGKVVDNCHTTTPLRTLPVKWFTEICVFTIQGETYLLKTNRSNKRLIKTDLQKVKRCFFNKYFVTSSGDTYIAEVTSLCFSKLTIKNVKQVFTLYHLTYFLTEEGEIIYKNYNSDTCYRELLPPVVKVVTDCSSAFSRPLSALAIDYDGRLWINGSNYNSVLGLGMDGDRFSWKLITDVVGKVKDVKTTTSVSALITTTGDLYVCGFDPNYGNYRLGSNKDTLERWTKVEGLPPLNKVKIYSAFTLVTATNGDKFISSYDFKKADQPFHWKLITDKELLQRALTALE